MVLKVGIYISPFGGLQSGTEGRWTNLMGGGGGGGWAFICIET